MSRQASAAHRLYGDVIISVPPNLGGVLVANGRNVGIEINPYIQTALAPPVPPLLPLPPQPLLMLTNEGAGTGLVYDQTLSGIAYFRTLQEGTGANAGIQITTDTFNQVVVIGNTMTGANLGGGQNLFAGKTAAGVLQFKSLVAGANIILTPTAGDITITAVPGGGAAFIQGGNSFGAPAILGTNDANSLTLITGGLAALALDIAQNAAFSGTLASGTGGGTGGSLALNGATSGSFVQNVPAVIPASYSVVWPAVQGAAGSLLENDGAGNLSWQAPGTTSSAFSRITDSVTSQLELAYNPLFPTAATDNFLVGPQTTEGASTRMMMINSTAGGQGQGSFRAGSVTGTAWDAANRGTDSAAFGSDCTASGASTFSAGASNIASGSIAAVIGGGLNTASNTSSIVAGGLGCTASGQQAGVFAGDGCVASSARSVVLGGNTCSTDANDSAVVGGSNCVINSLAGRSVIMGGVNNTVSASASNCLVSGFGNTAGAANCVVMGADASTTGAANNTFSWGDGAAPLAVSTPQTFNVQAVGGLQLSGNTTTTSGNLALKGFTSGAVTHTVPASVTSYSVAWPSAQGAASTVLTNDGAGNLSWVAAASSANAVQGTLTSSFSTASGAFVPTGLSATITPSSVTSRIKISVTGTLGNSMASASANASIFRGVTNIGGTDGFVLSGVSAASVTPWTPTCIVYLDSPATTLATTYTLQIKTGGVGTAFWNVGAAKVTVILLEEVL